MRLSSHFSFTRNIHSTRVSLKQQTFFIKRLAFLLKAGVSLSESLLMLTEQARSVQQKKVLEHITDSVLSGRMLSKSLAAFPSMFNQFSVSIVAVGENSGTLSRNLEYLAEELQKRSLLRGKVISALIYPALITVSTLLITVFLTVYLFPKILPVFASLHTTLPLSTRFMIFLSEMVSRWGILLCIVAPVSVAALYILSQKSTYVQLLFHRSITRLPLFGSMVRNYNIANATRTLGLLLSSGVTVTETIEVTARTTPNLVYREEYLQLLTVVTRGEKMSNYIQKRSKLFPEVVHQMLFVGERSGTLSQTLLYISELFDREVEDIAKNFSTLIEPALMIGMGLLVGFIAISIISPIYGLTQSLHA